MEDRKMYEGRMVFSQVMDYFPARAFQTILERYNGNKWVQSFTCRSHFNALAFGQLTGCKSLRDIEVRLVTNRRHLHHLGIPASGVSRNNLAHANETRDWRIYRDVALTLVEHARGLYAEEDIGVDVDGPVYAFDSTTIDLCLSLFPWANFRSTKAGIKAHTAIDVRGGIPTFINITEAKQNDMTSLDTLPIEKESFYLIDRGYLDFSRLYAIHQAGAFFVTRLKKNSKFKRRYSQKVDRATGVKCDQTGNLCGNGADTAYPDAVRVVSFVDPETGKRLRFLTNYMECDALTICLLYKLRWQVELFFKWMKQHLSIKHFLGTSENAVHVQIWTAVASYTLVAIMRKELRIEKSMYEILQFLRVSIFEKTSIIQAFSEFTKDGVSGTPLFQGEFW